MTDYQFYVSQGICPQCHKRKKEQGNLCEPCRKMQRDSYARNREKRCAKAKEKYHERKEAGLCPTCGLPVDNGRIYCSYCTARQNISRKKWYERKKRNAKENNRTNLGKN
jgi:hypothetical protein